MDRNYPGPCFAALPLIDCDLFNTLTVTVNYSFSCSGGVWTGRGSGSKTLIFTRIPYDADTLGSIPADKFMLARGDGTCCSFNPLHLFGDFGYSTPGGEAAGGNPLGASFSGGTVGDGPWSTIGLSGSLGYAGSKKYIITFDCGGAAAVNADFAPVFANGNASFSTPPLDESAIMGTHSFSSTFNKPPGAGIDSDLSTVSVTVEGSVIFA